MHDIYSVPESLGKNNNLLSWQSQEHSFENNRNLLEANLVSLFHTSKTVAETFSHDDMYKLVVGLQLQQGSDGLYSGVIRDCNGAIIKHAKFEKIPPDISKCVAAIGSQFLLIHIASQINKIQEQISSLATTIEDIGHSKIESGINQYKNAIGSCDLGLLRNAIQTLNDGVFFELRILKGGIEKLSPRISIFDNWNLFYSKSDLISHEIEKVNTSFHFFLLGTLALAECHGILEPDSGRKVIRDIVKKFSVGDFTNIINAARVTAVRKYGTFPPEEKWKEFQKCCICYYDQSLEIDNLKEISMQITSAEMKENGGKNE